MDTHRSHSMSIAALVAAILSALWIDYGWQPLAGGGNEYILQVPPELVDTLRSEGIVSYIPPGIENIRRIRVTVGRETLPQKAATESQAPSPPAANDQPTKAQPRTNEGEERVAKYPDESQGAMANDDQKSSTTDSNSVFPVLGLDALTLAAIGLGIAVALVVFLTWANLSMRARYRALLLDQRHELRHGSAGTR
jgi:hypothetical protein